MDACSSLLEAMNRVWAVPVSSPPPYQEDLLRLEWDVVDIQTAVGEAEAREMYEEPVRRWLMEVKEACSVAKNRLREFQIKSSESEPKLPVRGSIKQKDVVDSWIRETIGRFDELTLMGRALDLDLDLGSQIGLPVVYGIDDDRKKVIELLLSGYREEGNVSVVGISAADGMGKTTLCHLVYNDPEVIRKLVRNTQIFEAASDLVSEEKLVRTTQ